MQAGEWKHGLKSLHERLQIPVRTYTFSSDKLSHPFGFETVKVVTVKVRIVFCYIICKQFPGICKNISARKLAEE